MKAIITVYDDNNNIVVENTLLSPVHEVVNCAHELPFKEYTFKFTVTEIIKE